METSTPRPRLKRAFWCPGSGSALCTTTNDQGPPRVLSEESNQEPNWLFEGKPLQNGPTHSGSDLLLTREWQQALTTANDQGTSKSWLKSNLGFWRLHVRHTKPAPNYNPQHAMRPPESARVGAPTLWPFFPHTRPNAQDFPVALGPQPRAAAPHDFWVL